MCFYYQLSADAKKLENRFQKQFPKGNLTFQEKNTVNAFDFPSMPIVLKEEIEFMFYNWGLIPHWAKEEVIKKYTLNARIETLSEKPSFKDVLHKRCLVPATGFYEWKCLETKGKQKEKYLIKKNKEPIFSFAGLFSSWINRNSGNTIYSFTILTTQANSLMASIHNTKKRMPVILKKEDELSWLQGDNYTNFAFPYTNQLVAQALPL